MPTDIRLREYSSTSVLDLTAEEVVFVADQLGSRIDISRPALGDGHVLRTRQYVGVVLLPTGRRLVVEPKVPVANLGHMLATALELPEFRHEVTGFERFDDLLEHVARYFADLVELRIDRGLYRSYVEHRENLNAMRGRIDLAEDMRRNAVLRHRTYCEFTEFTWDVPENQVIRQVARMLAGWDFSSPLRTRLRNIDAALGSVRVGRMDADAVSDFRYYRFNDDYRPIHRLCQLFLQGTSLSEELGQFDARTFLVDMNKLFEAFVTGLLQEQADQPLRVAGQHGLFLDSEELVRLRPDIVVFSRSDVLLVADCKYKQRGPDEFRTTDVYQLLAYAEALRTSTAIILIPQHEEPITQAVTVPEVPVQIRQISVDLGVAPALFQAGCVAFAREVLLSTQAGASLTPA